MKTNPSLGQRSSGILLPLASLPGRGPVGDLGLEAYAFVDFLAAAGQHWWQMLPIQPIGEGYSPYRSPSAFAGGSLYISLESLRREGWLKANEITFAGSAQQDGVDYLTARKQKEKSMRLAFRRFQTQSTSVQREDFESFVEQENYWLPDYAFFAALRRAFKNRPWTSWPMPLRQRASAAMSEARQRLWGEIRFQQFVQWQFQRQWERLKSYAAKRGVGMIGDVPIFVSPDSADVWAHPQIFKLKPNGTPSVVAGVPPDYFSKTGQLWGNPPYRWDVLAKDNYRWWIERFHRAHACFDAVRLDHFIGFVRAYEVPSGARTAMHGRYQPGPGGAFFRAVFKALPKIKFIAEDLGVVTPEVMALRHRWKLPGMHVLQFDWEKLSDEKNTVAYTGTHDNDTTRGWYESLPSEIQQKVCQALGVGRGKTVSWALVEKALRSPAHTAITPVQDLLDLDSKHRVNTPGTPRGNWRWRLDARALTPNLRRQLKALTISSNR